MSFNELQRLFNFEKLPTKSSFSCQFSSWTKMNAEVHGGQF